MAHRWNHKHCSLVALASILYAPQDAAAESRKRPREEDDAAGSRLGDGSLEEDSGSRAVKQLKLSPLSVPSLPPLGAASGEAPYYI